MRQIFFISPNGYMPVREAFTPPVNGANTHGWSPEGVDPKTGQVVGVVEMNGQCDAELVIERLEAQGILWLPNHSGNEAIREAHLKHLQRHGVKPGHTTLQAMHTVHGISKFAPLKPKRF